MMSTLFPVRGEYKSGGDNVLPLLGDHSILFNKVLDGSAGAATAETVLFVAPFNGYLDKVQLVPDAALTADDTNYATISVHKRAAADYTTKVDVAEVTTETDGTGDFVAWTPVDFGLTPVSFAEGDILTFEIAKAGTGVVVPDSVLSLTYRKVLNA